MPLDPSIPLSVRPPEATVSPFQSLGALMQMRGQASEIALRQAQAQQAAAQTANIQAQEEDRQRKLRDQQQLQSIAKDTFLAGGGWSDVFKKAKTEGTISPETIMEAETNYGKQVEQTAKARNEELTGHVKAIDTLTPALQSILDAPNTVDKNAQYQGFRARSMANPDQNIRDVAQKYLPDTWNDEQAKQLIAMGLGTKDLLQAGINRQKETREAATSAAELPGKQATSEKEVLQLGILKKALAQINSDPQSGPSVIDTILPPTLDATANNAYKTAYAQAAATDKPLESMNAVITAAAAHAAALSPQKRAIEVQQDVAKAKAIAPIETQRAVTTAVATEKAKAALAPGYLAGIQDPALQHQIAQQYGAANVEYQGKVADAQRLQNLVQAAEGGNQAAAAMLKTAEVRELVNRVNTTELSAAGGGSVARRIENYFSTGFTGVPIKDTLNDFKQFSNLVLDAAKRGYGGKVAGFNALGAKIPTEPPSMPATAAPTGGSGKIRARDPQGKLHEAPAGTALPAGWKLEP